MKKTPTLFVRNPDDRRFVTAHVTPGCEWVLAGEGQATRQYDGACVLFDPELTADAGGAPTAQVPQLQGWWARRKIKPGGAAPEMFVAVETDPGTGKTVGWEPAENSGWARYLAEAVGHLSDGPEVGTHELLGPKINRNPESMARHVVIAHRDAAAVDAPRDFEGLTVWLLLHPYEGVVWHHPDGRMAKLKRRDMRR